MNIGIIGCGAISSQYMIGFEKNKIDVNVVACAGHHMKDFENLDVVKSVSYTHLTLPTSG